VATPFGPYLMDCYYHVDSCPHFSEVGDLSFRWQPFQLLGQASSYAPGELCGFGVRNPPPSHANPLPFVGWRLPPRWKQRLQIGPRLPALCLFPLPPPPRPPGHISCLICGCNPTAASFISQWLYFCTIRIFFLIWDRFDRICGSWTIGLLPATHPRACSPVHFHWFVFLDPTVQVSPPCHRLLVGYYVHRFSCNEVRARFSWKAFF